MDREICVRNKVDLELLLLDRSAKPTYLPLSLLEDITNSFSDDRQIGSGGFAVVYKGIVGKGIVAVKKLSRTFGMHEIKFHKEVECLMKAKHKNIVHFLGYCSETHGRTADYDGKFVMADIRNWLLCFEYVPNGSLDKYITDASRGLEWRLRYEIIKGICEGLLHLHEIRILHLDLKPGNILVDDHMVPKIADFGLSRFLDKEQTRVFTSSRCGSQGYLAPEFFGGQIAFSSDIYSLGVIIVEMLTGEKGYPEDENVIRNWMNRLEGSDHWDVQLEQVRVCIKIGIDCMDLDPKKRPVARHIIDRLDEIPSTIETSIASSSAEQQVSVLTEQYCQEKKAKLASEHPRKDKKAETEDLVKNAAKRRKDHWQQGQEEALADQRSLWGAQDASVSTSNSGLLSKLSNLDIFNTKARRNYVINGGPVLENEINLTIFKKAKLKPILKEHNLIGKGCLGELYFGFVDSQPVIVRKLIVGFSATLENGQFANEVSIQSKINHMNIAKLKGCCLEVDIPMLVYEWHHEGGSIKWHPKGSLHDILHGNNKVPLDLGMRLSIAAQVADALACMHSEHSKMLHGNVEPASILLDDLFVPKISDFGISRMLGGIYEHTGIANLAYMDPLYVQTSLLTEGSDVYSLGIIILELLTRKKATLNDSSNLVFKFRENDRKGRKSTKLFDKEIAVTRDLALLENMAKIAVECLDLYFDRRPKMTVVAKRLFKLDQSRKLSHVLASRV